MYTWPAWRLVATGKATFTEVSEKMSIDDILKLYDAINAIADAEAEMRKQQQQEQKDQ